MATFEEVLKKAPTYFTNKFNKDVADEFLNYLEEEEIDSIETIINDVNESIEASSIIDSLSNKFNWKETEQTEFFNALNILLRGEDNQKQLPSDINWTNFTDSDCKETREYINKQCFNAFSGFDQSFITIETIGRNHNINIVPLLFDIYTFYKYKHLNNKNISNITHSQFCNKSLVLRKLQQKDDAHKKIYSSLVQTMASFQHRINPAFHLGSLIKIDDNINPYIQYTLNVTNMLNKVISNNGKCLPLLVDLWIIPLKAREALNVANDADGDDDSDEEDEDEDEEDEKEDTMTKSFEENLKKYGAKYEISTIDHQAQAQCARTLEGVFKKILNESRRSVKICIIIDRRKQKDNLLIYQLPLKYSAIPRNYCNETLIYSSSEHIMYDIDNSILKRDKKKLLEIQNDPNAKEPIFGAKFDCDGKMFCLSFAVHETNKTRIQFWRNGGGVRFWPNYMINIWPKLFINPKIEKKYLENDYIEKQFGLNVTDTLFNAWYDSIVDFDK